MARDAYKNGTQFETVGALRQALFTSWRNIPVNLVRTLVSSMPQRVIEVINKNGGGTQLSTVFTLITPLLIILCPLVLKFWPVNIVLFF